MVLYDENGQKYIISDDKLGEGGQGAVYHVSNNKRVAIKVKVKASIEDIDSDKGKFILCDEDEYEKYSTKIRHIMAINALSCVPNLATPIAMLKKPQCGYVMRFMSEMECIGKQMKREEDTLITKWGTNNSLKKKYKVLSNLATIISKLNAAGLVYCDIAPGNVYVSKNYDSYETWLIDTDNLHYLGTSNTTIGTPRYRAPEVAKSTISGNTFESDIYSFALLAYEYLTLSTPFNGSMVVGSDDCDTWDQTDSDVIDINEIEKKIEMGDIPYIYEEKGNDPVEESGIPAEYVFTDEIYDLFLRTFCEQGRRNPSFRPKALEWAEAFDRAYNDVGYCSNGHSHIGSECLWCLLKDKEIGVPLKDQNRYFILSVSDLVREDDGGDWDCNEAPAELLQYQDCRIRLSHRIDGKTHIKLPGDSIGTVQPIEIDINSANLSINFPGTKFTPFGVTWKYKEDTSDKEFYLKRNGEAFKFISIHWENRQ